jgi:hypothetical protein
LMTIPSSWTAISTGVAPAEPKMRESNETF